MPPLWAKWASSLKRDAHDYMKNLEIENELLKKKINTLEIQIDTLKRDNQALREKTESEAQQT